MISLPRRLSVLLVPLAAVLTLLGPAPSAAADDRWAAATYSQPATIAVIGDSISYGAGETGTSSPKYSTSWPGQLRWIISTHGYGNAGTGIVPANAILATHPTYDRRWTLPAGIATPDLGLHKAGVHQIPEGSTETFTCTASCVRFTIYTLGSSTGTARLQVDSQAAVTAKASTASSATVAPTAGYRANHYVTTVPTGSPAPHTLKITAVGGTVRLFGVDASTGAGRIRVSNLSISGRSLTSLGADPAWTNETSGGYGYPILDTYLRSSGLTTAVIELGVNDWLAGRSTATIEQLLRSTVARVRADGATPLLYLPPQPNPALAPAGAPTYTQVATTYARVAADTSTRLLDQRRLYAPTLTNETAIYAAGQKLGVYADGIHPNDKGSWWMLAGRSGTTGIADVLGIPTT